MKKSIRRWMVSLYVLLALVPLLFMGLALSATGGALQMRQAEDMQVEIARHSLAELENIIKALETVIHGFLKVNNPMALSPRLQEAALADILTYFKGSAYGDLINELVLLEGSGRVLARASRFAVYEVGQAEDFSQTDEFLGPMVTGRPSYGSVRFDQRTREPIITIGYPVEDLREGRVLGVLVAEVRLKEVWSRIREVSRHATFTEYMLDGGGRLIAHPNYSLVLGGTRAEVPEGAGLVKGLSGGWVFSASESLMLGNKYYYLVVERPVLKALSLPLYTLLITAVFFLAMLGAAVYFGYLMVRRIVRPLESLASTASQIGGGDLGIRAERFEDDEIGLVADTFNAMAANLIENIDSLTREVTVRRAIEGALEGEKERLAATLSSMGDGLIATDNYGNIILMNGAAERMTGWGQAEALEETVEQVYPVREAEADSGHQRFVLSAKDGTSRFISQRTNRISDSTGRTRGRIIVFRDVSEEVKAERLIRKQNEFLSSMLESITHPFYVVDTRTHVVKIANSASKFGPLAAGSKCHVLTHKSEVPCSGGAHPCTILEVLRMRGPVRLEHVHYESQREEPLYIEIHGYPIFDEEGNINEIIEYTVDITERKKQEAKLLRTSSLEAIGRLAAGVAHEINTPLTNASLGLEMIMAAHKGESPEGGPDIRRLKAIELNIDKASKIAQELLWFSRQKGTELVPVDMNSVVESALFMTEWKFKNIEIDVQSTDLPPVLGDALKLEQALVNIISNAAEAMPGGGVLHIRTGMREGDGVVVEVSDTGHGIERERLGKVFEPFYTTKPGGLGTGLGLAICSEIIQQHEGEISLSSEKGKGTTVRIHLPVAPSAPAL